MPRPPDDARAMLARVRAMLNAQRARAGLPPAAPGESRPGDRWPVWEALDAAERDLEQRTKETP